MRARSPGRGKSYYCTRANNVTMRVWHQCHNACLATEQHEATMGFNMFYTSRIWQEGWGIKTVETEFRPGVVGIACSRTYLAD